MPPSLTVWKGCRVTVMGLGSFGGGIGLARYLAEQGASVTVTDLKDATALPDALEALQGLPIRFVLGRAPRRRFRRHRPRVRQSRRAAHLAVLATGTVARGAAGQRVEPVRAPVRRAHRRHYRQRR